MNLDISNLGQVFTPNFIVNDMLNLIKNKGLILEPSCGNGAFTKHLSNFIGIEIDKKFCGKNILNVDFFDYSLDEKFDTIIGNPPYVRYQDINYETKIKLQTYKNMFDERSNLYLFFIFKSILHLKNGGELIFITPRDFLKNTSSIKLNEFIFNNGTITDFIDLGDKKIFDNAQPNCAIWRFEKGNFKRSTNCLREFNCINGQIIFTTNEYYINFNELFFVKVGAVSGNDAIFTNDKFGNLDFVYSKTCKNGKTKKMIYNTKHSFLINFKEKLKNRKIRTFNEENWWMWGRDYYKSDEPRIYVNTKTRNKKPFFIHRCKAYDGSILAIFPKFKVDDKILVEVCENLNNVNWKELGFVCDGRFLFSQRSLENTLLPEKFLKYINK